MWEDHAQPTSPWPLYLLCLAVIRKKGPWHASRLVFLFFFIDTLLSLSEKARKVALKVKQRRRSSVGCRLSNCFDVSTHLSRGDLQTAVLWEPDIVEKRFSPVMKADVELRISNRMWWSQHLGLWSVSEVRHPFSWSDFQTNPLVGCILSCSFANSNYKLFSFAFVL